MKLFALSLLALYTFESHKIYVNNLILVFASHHLTTNDKILLNNHEN